MRQLLISIAAISVAAMLPMVLLAQSEITSVDYFGLRQLKQSDIEAVLDLKTGEPLRISVSEIESRVGALDGVAEVNVAPIRYPGNLALFIGVRENDQPAMTFRDSPTGESKIDPELLKAYNQTMQMLVPAIRSGKAGEDRSAGHSVSEYEPLKELQLGFIEIANDQFDELDTLLKESADADSRVAAAYIIAYATDKQRVVESIHFACDDADAGVRNNAVRALAVLSNYANENPELDLHVDPTPFLQLLRSPTWTDRNKGAAAVDSISRGRDPEFLERLRTDCMNELVEMAKWKSSGHAFFSIRILARMANFPEEVIIEKCKGLKSHEDRLNWVETLVDTINNTDK